MSHIDQIMTELVALTGTVTDRERQRLLTQLILTEPQGSMMDLYALAAERPRIWGYPL